MLVGTPLTINKTNTSEGTVISNGTANVKNQVVSIAKTVDDNTVQQGENAKYTLSTKIPNYVGYKVQGYSFTVTDGSSESVYRIIQRGLPQTVPAVEELKLVWKVPSTSLTFASSS